MTNTHAMIARVLFLAFAACAVCAQEDMQTFEGSWEGSGQIHAVYGTPGPNDDLGNWDGSVDAWKAGAVIRPRSSLPVTGEPEGALEVDSERRGRTSNTIGKGPIDLRLHVRRGDVELEWDMGGGGNQWVFTRGLKTGQNLMLRGHYYREFIGGVEYDWTLTLNLTKKSDDALLGYWWYVPSSTPNEGGDTSVSDDIRWAFGGHVELYRVRGDIE